MSGDLAAENVRLREAVQLAVDIMAMLDVHPSMLGHYLDTDDNDGERFRWLSEDLGFEPSESIDERIAALGEIEPLPSRGGLGG